MQTAVTRFFTNLCLRFSSKETPLRVLRPRQADVKSPLISPRPQSRPRLSARKVSARSVDGGIVCTGFLRCHCEPVRRLAWQSVPRARRRGIPSPPSARKVSRLHRDGGRDMPRHTGRCGHRPLRSAYRKRTRYPSGRAEPRPYTRSDVPCERPLPLPLGEVAERSEDGEGKP